MRTLRTGFAGLAALLLATGVVAAPVQEDPIERQMLDIAHELRCAVCQNQPVSESNADLAKDMRKVIREQLEAGKTRDEIVEYFVARYGDYVLMKPPAAGPGALLWIAPPLLFVLLAVSGWLFLRRRARPSATPAPTLSAADQERVRAVRQHQQDS